MLASQASLREENFIFDFMVGDGEVSYSLASKMSKAIRQRILV